MEQRSRETWTKLSRHAPPREVCAVRELRFQRSLLGSEFRLTTSEKRKIEAAAQAVSAFELRYRSSGHDVVGFVVIPKRVRQAPLILYNRGGYENFGALSEARVFSRLAMLAQHGFVVGASQYRGWDGTKGLDEHGGDDLLDVLLLKRILCGLSIVDEKRIGMCGASRGGMMTYLLLSRYRWIQAACIIGGLADLDRSARVRPDIRSVYREAFGNTAAGRRARSGVKLARRFPQRCPILLLHGAADWRVDVADSIDMSRHLLRWKIPHRLIVYEGADHSLTEVREETWNEMAQWFKRFLRKDRKMPTVRPHGP